MTSLAGEIWYGSHYRLDFVPFNVLPANGQPLAQRGIFGRFGGCVYLIRGQPVESVVAEALGETLDQIRPAGQVADGVEAEGKIGNDIARPRLHALYAPGVGIFLGVLGRETLKKSRPESYRVWSQHRIRRREPLVR